MATRLSTNGRVALQSEHRGRRTAYVLQVHGEDIRFKNQDATSPDIHNSLLFMTIGKVGALQTVPYLLGLPSTAFGSMSYTCGVDGLA